MKGIMSVLVCPSAVLQFFLNKVEYKKKAIKNMELEISIIGPP